MLRILGSLLSLAIVGAVPVQAKPFNLNSANSIATACESKDSQINDAHCFTYVVAVAEMYFLSNPSCSRPDFQQFMGAALENIIATTSAMNPQQLASETSANVVYQAIAKAHPCQTAEKSGAPSPDACRDGVAALNNPWISSYQKQAILELLRNKGCLN